MMATNIPQKSDFEKARLNDKYSRYAGYFFAAISLASVIISKAKYDGSIIDYIIMICVVLATAAVCYFQFRYVLSYRKAEETRRDGLFDNSFKTKMADITSEGYYDNENIEYGMKKLLSNIHENSFFSSRIVDAMFKNTEKINIFLVILLTTLTVLNFMEMRYIVAVFSIFFSLGFLDDYLKIRALQRDLDAVQTKCKSIWTHYSDKRGNPDMQSAAEVIRVAIQYETSLAYASLMFDSKEFEKLNVEISSEWEEMKKRFCS